VRRPMILRIASTSSCTIFTGGRGGCPAGSLPARLHASLLTPRQSPARSLATARPVGGLLPAAAHSLLEAAAGEGEDEGDEAFAYVPL
jgi:hypothetical protein